MAIKKVRIRPEGGNNYADIIHPETSADIVIESENKMFVSSAEKTNWNNKADKDYVDTQLNTKVDKVSGKQLSTEDYTTTEKNKLAGIEDGANKTIINNTLTSTSTTQALSARQGKALKDDLDVHKTQKATQTTLGHVKAGQNITIDSDGTINAKGAVDIGTFNNEEELIIYVIMNQLPTGQYVFFIGDLPYFMLLRDEGSYYAGVLQDSEATYVHFQVGKTGEIIFFYDLNIRHLSMLLHDLADFSMPKSGGVLEDYAENFYSLNGTSPTIDLSYANVFTHTLTGNTTYSIRSNPDYAGDKLAYSFTLIITQTETARAITFPANVKWQGGEIPDLTTANKTYVLTFLTVNKGATWLGMFGGEF